MQAADLGGLNLLSLLVTGTAAALVAGYRGQRLPLVGMLGVLGGLTVYGLTRPALPPPDRTAVMVQGAVPPRQGRAAPGNRTGPAPHPDPAGAGRRAGRPDCLARKCVTSVTC
ncbi:hypothetical protein ACFSC4_29950 [Deinococcus malanensis]|uniref:hypothetical protein n=1 Tax=Deinococcus malanensis TaxID=1706855 RepID=UPI003633882D